MNPSRILVIAGSPDSTKTIQHLLSSYPDLTVAISSEPDAPRRIEEEAFSVLMLAVNGPSAARRELFATIQRKAVTIPIIGIVDRTDTVQAPSWANFGAFEILAKPLDRSSVLSAVKRALIKRELCVNDEPPRPEQTKQEDHRSYAGQIIGDSAVMQAVYHCIDKVALSDLNVCIHGETGTGKELVARAIHTAGRRWGRPFVVLDCTALPDGLMESEVFGHVRGAFTSAVGDRVGVFQLADTGTLFLDEVGELPLPLQAKLLRVIQHREFRRVGSNHPTRVDVRIIAATNQDLGGLVKAGRFREDLFYRLDVASITLPPLRERQEDIPLLVRHFIQEFNRQSDKHIRGVTARTLRLMLQYDWPGNVRELRNCIERAGVMAEREYIDIADLRKVFHPASPNGLRAGSTLWETERDLILEALRTTRGNRTAAAALLGVSRRGLLYKLKRITPEAGPEPAHP